MDSQMGSQNENPLNVNEDSINGTSTSSRKRKSKFVIEGNIPHRISFINNFAFKIFKELPRNDKNHIICPVNLFTSFALLLIGSNGRTFTDLQEFLDCKSWRPSFKGDNILKTIKSVLQVFAYDKLELRPNYELFNVIRLLVDERARYSDKYRILIKRYFNVDIDRIDFERDWELIVDQITEVMRNELNSKNVCDFQINVDKWTQIIILSAVRFKCKWDLQFDEIREGYFFIDSERKTTVKMMAFLQKSFRYDYIQQWDSYVVEIPFAAQSMSFIMIVPKYVDGLDRLVNRLDTSSLVNAINGLHITKCDIFLPKFKLECDYDFAKVYPNLNVFGNDCQLLTIGGKHRIKANNILHKVVFEINENGLYSSTNDLTNKGDSKIIRADHPFVFVVKDKRTQNCVFFGKIQSL